MNSKEWFKQYAKKHPEKVIFTASDMIEAFESGKNDHQTVKDLSMLVRRHAVKLKKLKPDSKLIKQSTDYLQKYGLTGDILRVKNLKKFVDNQKDMPREFIKTADDHFWELV